MSRLIMSRRWWAGALALGLASILLVALSWFGRHGAAPDASSEAEATGCLGCHSDAGDDPGGAHAAARMGCEVCHGGDPAGTNVLDAHVGLELEPGALDTVASTCGGCHPVETERVQRSLMATGRGMIAVDRHAFGEIEEPDGEETFESLLALDSPSAGQDHLRRLCAGCHLGTRRENRDDSVTGIGSGCSSCHVATTPGASHPSVDLHVPDDRCLGCHSRSSRISLSYQGLAEVSGEGSATCDEPSRLFDGREGCRVEADVHHEAGMGCTDCHLHSELMGDGVSYAHAEDATEVRCESCHGPTSPAEERPWGEVDDPISTALLRLRGTERSPDEVARLGRRGTPLWNLRPGEEGGWVLDRKADGERLPVAPTPVDSAHRQRGHERLGCASCHAAWAPRCPTCHTRFDPEGEQWDFGAARVVSGAWVETSEGMSFGAPTLGVTPEGRIEPAIPGMIATIDTPGSDPRELRLFSTLDPHTTSRRGRSCGSCHADGAALGLGAGRLEREGGSWRFIPSHPVSGDPTRARDAWTSLSAAEPGRGTRLGARSLDRSEIDRILFVGLCLRCHAEDAGIFEEFPRSWERLRDGSAAGCQFSP